MSNFDIVNLALVTTVLLSLGYTAFWARNVQKALAVGVYRRQALGIVLISVTLALYQIANTAEAYFVFHNGLEANGEGGFGLFFIFLVAVFYWVDASVLAARRSNSLLKDYMHWSKVRIILWVGTLPAAIIVVAVSVVSLFVSGGNSGIAPTWAGIFLFPGIFIPLFSCAIVIPIIALKTPDKILRAHLKWFGLFGIIYLAFNFLTANLSDITMALFLTYLGDIVCAYCLYRSALSLTPLKIPVATAKNSQSKNKMQ